MLCVLEGADGTGKSTMVKALRTRQKLKHAEVIHRGPPVADPLHEYELPLQAYSADEPRHIICDRLHLGELVYGPLLRGTSRLDRARLLHIHLFLRSRGAYVVILRETERTLRGRLARNGDDLITAAHLPELIVGYADVFREGWADRFSYVTTVADIITQAEIRQDAVRGLRRFRTYIGGPEPVALLLGDRHGRQGPFDACFTPDQGTSGSAHYLLSHLPLPWAQHVGIANASQDYIPDLWERLSRPPIVCLGRVAERKCKTWKLPYSVVPHPQYIKRFHHRRGDEYGEIIKTASLKTGEEVWAWS